MIHLSKGSLLSQRPSQANQLLSRLLSEGHFRCWVDYAVMLDCRASVPQACGYWGSAAHAPNENIRLADLQRAVRYNCYMFQALGG